MPLQDFYFEQIRAQQERDLRHRWVGMAGRPVRHEVRRRIAGWLHHRRATTPVAQGGTCTCVCA